MLDNYPKVLIVNCQSIYADNATGITLRNLWNCWPADKAFELVIDSYGKRVDSEIKISSISIPPNIVTKLAHSGKAKKINQGLKDQGMKQRNSLKSNLRQAAVLTLDAMPRVVRKWILEKLDNFRPEVIYTLGASVECLRIVDYLHRRYSVPIVIHFMDNWVEHLQWDDNSLIKPYRFALKSKLNRCMSCSPVCFAISEMMAKEYSSIFPKTTFIALMNSVDCRDLNNSETRSGKTNTFVYTGGLHLDRWKGLLDIGKALKECNPGSVLRIYTSTNVDEIKEHFADLPVEFNPPVPHEAIDEVFDKADCLVHVEVDNELLLGFFKYSISTKIPEYLSSGRVVLFYGPKNIGLYEYLEKNKIALVCSDYEALKEQIGLLCSNDGSINDIVERAIGFAKKNHSSETAHRVLRFGISSCLKAGIKKSV